MAAKKNEKVAIFAAAMRLEQKRQLCAWVLLLVFIPMVATALFHVHSDCSETELTCQACVNHQAHAGHLSSATGHLHDCVLCQLMSTSYLVASFIILPILVARYRPLYAELATILQHAQRGIVGLRAPPFRG